MVEKAPQPNDAKVKIIAIAEKVPVLKDDDPHVDSLISKVVEVKEENKVGS